MSLVRVKVWRPNPTGDSRGPPLWISGPLPPDRDGRCGESLTHSSYAARRGTTASRIPAVRLASNSGSACRRFTRSLTAAASRAANSGSACSRRSLKKQLLAPAPEPGLPHAAANLRREPMDVDNRLRRPAALPPLPERARKAGKCSPSPTYPQGHSFRRDGWVPERCSRQEKMANNPMRVRAWHDQP